MHAETKSGIAKSFRQLIAASILVGATGLAYSANAGPTYEYFDAGLPKESRLYSYSLNASGVIVGEAEGRGRSGPHGFVRNADGTIVVLGRSTSAFDINDAGQVVGIKGNKGFLRQPDGMMKTFQVQGTVLTSAAAINAKGDCVGYYIVDGGVSHAFLRTADGKVYNIDTVDGPIHQDAIDINSKREIIGRFYDTMWHGFIRDPEGNVTILDPPDGGGITLMSINNKGEATGFIYGSDSLTHGFVRSADGILTEFDVSGASETVASSINNKGAVTGYFYDTGGQHGYLRAPDGTITTIDVPVKNAGTWPFAINDAGEITGSYYDHDRHQTMHGFLRHP